jgi:hypothetical protein
MVAFIGHDCRNGLVYAGVALEGSRMQGDPIPNRGQPAEAMFGILKRDAADDAVDLIPF